MSNATRTVRNFQLMTLDELYASDFQKKGTMTARVRQIVETLSYYPSMKPTNSKSDNIFAIAEFGEAVKDQEFKSTENRVAFINVPASTTAEEVTKRIVGLGENARIYRELANKPILTEEQATAIVNGITTLETIAESQAVRYPEGAIDRETQEDVSGKLILDSNGKIQYRAMYFSTKKAEDIDNRSSDPNDMYITPALEQELNATFFEATTEPVATNAAPQAMQEA